MTIQELLDRFIQARRGAGQGRGGGAGIGRGGTGLGGGGGRGGGNNPGSGPGGDCVCSKCGKRIPHIAGQRCVDRACPNCGTRMIKE